MAITVWLLEDHKSAILVEEGLKPVIGSGFSVYTVKESRQWKGEHCRALPSVVTVSIRQSCDDKELSLK